MTGKKSNISAVCAAVVLAATAFAATVSAETADSYLLPGVDLRGADLSVGRWCRYLVVDEADDVRDTTDVYAAVVAREGPDSASAFWIEFAATPARGGPGERDVTVVLISATIKDLSAGDSLYHFVKKLYIKRGTEPVAPADPRDLKRLTLADPTAQEDWLRTEGVTVTTPKGDFACERRELTVEESREVPAGRVRIAQHRRDHFVVWSSPAVPIFGLVRCVIERERESRTIPPIRGIPEAGPRTSRVTTLVVDFGDGATPLVALP